MSRSIKIDASGKGSVAIGNLVQGDQASVGGEQQQVIFRQLDELRAELRGRAEAEGDDPRELDAIVDEVRHELARNRGDDSRLKAILEGVKDHHSWAFPLLRGIVERALPALGLSL